MTLGGRCFDDCYAKIVLCFASTLRNRFVVDVAIILNKILYR